MNLENWKNILWWQFGAAIDMLKVVMLACPEELWSASLQGEQAQEPDFSEFWYVTYHTLFWLDLYLSGAVEGFAPPDPFDLAELDPAGLLPERQYTKQELHDYLKYCREKCRTRIEGLTEEQAEHVCRFPWGEVSFTELLLYNMRHVQEHTAQLSLFLGQKAGREARWFVRARER